MIADALKEAHDIEIDRRRIDLKNPIKVAGKHEVVVSIYRDIKTTLALVVGSAETFAAEASTEGEAVEQEAQSADATVEDAEDAAAKASAEETAE